MDQMRKSKRHILKLFPFLQDPTKAPNLKIDAESIHYISHRDDAQSITKIIIDHLKKDNKDLKNITITDATAGVGGNAISFALNFSFVYAIELDELRSSYLANNLEVYNLKNYAILQDDCLKVLPLIQDHKVVFIDPPWGGKGYKTHENLRLTLSDISLEALCNSLLDPTQVTKCPDYIVLKLPANYDVSYLYRMVLSKEIYFYDLERMYIFVIKNTN